jgi:RHS repeat-associated protein
LTLKTPKTPGPITSYEYDAENKLVRVVSNGTTANYRYDGLGRRVEKEIVSASTTVTRYVYDNEDILLELDGSNNIVARYTHGPGIDEPLIMEKGGASFFYQADGLGSITEITNQSGSAVQRYTYSSFGKIESQLDPNFVQPYTFTGREYDPETGLYHYRKRDLDPNTGRFNQADPITFAAGPNFYVYVDNNPLAVADPFGLLNPVKAGVGLVNIGRGILSGAAGATTLIIAVVSAATPGGQVITVPAAAFAAYQLVIAMPGLIKRGAQQFGESIDEPLSCARLKNLLGLLPLGQFVDDPNESFSTAVQMKQDQGKRLFEELQRKPKESIEKAINFLQDFAF